MSAPLPERMRPRTLSEVVGHERWLGTEAPLRRALDRGELPSLILWGPPGCGKTTLARLLADARGAAWVPLSAVLDGVKALREALEQAAREREATGTTTALFVDEIHRWNKAQQDALLPHVESGAILLLGATTENPSFEVNPALRSRVRLIRLDPVPTEAVRTLLDRALAEDEALRARGVSLAPDALDALATASGGDVRQALADLEAVSLSVTAGTAVRAEDLALILRDRGVRHDKAGEDHYNVVSALIKSMRGSDPDAAVYWLARLIQGGESPRFIARRLVIFAAEDVGNADPRALQVAVAAAEAAERVGYPEARIPLAQAVTWLAASPKSNAAYLAINRAMEEVGRSGPLPVPLHLRNAATADDRAQGYGRGYRYPHDHPDRIVQQRYLPEHLEGRTFYGPTGPAEEKRIAERLSWWARKLAERSD
ncbi:MAG: replication-associated recombination protein A [Deltaproteobacteria bacterium]|nr:MAG: replication-associated recombination protein A [Deltaproteobacteria bacterium]